MSSREFVTFRICDQLFGLSVTEIHDVFRPSNMTRVPLAGPEIAGWFNTWDPESAEVGASYYEGAIGIDVSDGRVYTADSHRGLLVFERN